MLRTLNYHKHKSNTYTNIPLISSGYFNTRSTMEIIDDHYLFYVNERDLRIYITSERPTVTYSSPLFQQIRYLKLELPTISSSLLNKLLDIGKKNISLILICSIRIIYFLYKSFSLGMFFEKIFF